MVHCHAGCPTADVVTAIGLAMRDLFPPKPTTSGDRLVAMYAYRDEGDRVLFEKLRYVPKRFVQRRPDGNGYVYGLEGVRRVPYRLSELLEGITANRWVLVVEGEKAADRLVTEGFVATCGSGGAGKFHLTEREHFRDAKVVVLADNDSAGRDHALAVARSLEGLAETVKLLELPGLPEKGDVFDWLEQGHDAHELKELILNAPAWTMPLDVADEDGAQLLDELAVFIRRYVASGTDAIIAAVLWIAHTWAFDAADCSPRFVVLSAEPQSGKTRFLEVLKLLVRAALFAVNISDAALFRVIEAKQPTILHDEIDAVFGPKARDREDLRAMLDAGYERGAAVQRCVGDGSRQHVESFPVFTPVAMAGLGKLPETIEQRSIVARMKRRAPGETVDKLRRRQVGPEADALRARLEAWASRHLESLTAAEPEIPEELDDRAGDVWEPLFAIADAAGGDWPTRARDAARALYGARRTEEATIGVRLLADIRDVFNTDAGLASGDLADRLGTLEGSPWAEWSGQHRDRPISAHGLAKLLARYDIKPRQHRVATDTFRGYLRTDFEDAFARYVASSPDECNNRASATTQAQQGQRLLHSDTCCTSSGEESESDDLDRGLRIAQARAEEVRRRRNEAS
jgi:hypothetical protein